MSSLKCMQDLDEAREEAQQLAELLTYRQRSIAGTLGGGFPLMRASLWHSETAVAAAAQSLTPQMTENQAKVCTGTLLHETRLLLHENLYESHIMACGDQW